MRRREIRFNLSFWKNIAVKTDRHALALAIMAIFLLTVMDAIIKSLQPQFNAVQIMTMRVIIGTICSAGLFAFYRPGWPRPDQLKNHFLRSLIMLAAGLLFFYALGQMPLAELFVYTFTAPIFIALFGAFLLKERLSGSVVGGLALGFSGILLIVLTDPAARFGGGSLMGQAAAIFSPVIYSLSMVLLRKQSGEEPVARIVFMQSLCITILLMPTLLWDTPWPQGNDLAKVVIVGVLGTAGGFLLATAFSRSEAAKVAVSEYTGLIWAALIGYFAFQETPRPMVWLGAILVIAGCAVVARSKVSLLKEENPSPELKKHEAA
jgi:drug/metabolite transporter (DMT)-like permease